MKNLRFFRSTKVTTNPKICLEIMYDYTHFLYKHKSSFSDFRVISESVDEQIFYYETKIFNFLPFSRPVRKYLSIKKLFPEQKMFKQIYYDVNSKKTVYFKCYMVLEDNDNKISIKNDVVMEVSDFMYLFRKPLLWIVNKKFDFMWQEDKEMLEQLFKELDYQNIQCMPPYFNLNKLFINEFDHKFEKNKIDFDISI